MKKLYIALLLLWQVTAVVAQQEEQYTHFMYNKLGFNPAYAGSQDGATITALIRNQWLGIKGAPETQLLTFNMPLFNNNVGIGASIQRHTIGATTRLTAETAYAYRIKLGRGTLGIGLQGSIRFIQVDFDQVESTQPKETDGAIPVGVQSRYVPNFGAGLYYSNNRFFIGAAIPRLLENSIDLADQGGTLSKEIQHFYGMGGMLIRAGDKLEIQPQLLLKYVKGAPFDADINVNLIFSDAFTTGLSYRLGGSKRNGIGESLALLVGAQISDQFLLGVSYDMTLSDLRDFNSGSIEGVIRYSIGGRSKGDVYVNPRFF